MTIDVELCCRKFQYEESNNRLYCLFNCKYFKDFIIYKKILLIQLTYQSGRYDFWFVKLVEFVNMPLHEMF